MAVVQKLNLDTTRWTLEAATIATTYPDGKKIRWDPLRRDKTTTQFPEDAMIALTRQMILIHDKFQVRSHSKHSTQRFPQHPRGLWRGRGGATQESDIL